MMKFLVRYSLLPATGLIVLCATSVNAQHLSCTNLLDTDFDSVVISAAEELEFRESPSGPPTRKIVRAVVEHCRVSGKIDETIGFELLLPRDWNGKFMMGGVGGYAGQISISYQDGLSSGTPLQRGYATAGTDTGHQAPGMDASWALNDEQATINFAYLGVHRTAEVSKQIIGAYYGQEAATAYFLGCSGGGHQGLSLMQRYPNDFDGIAAGAPALNRAGAAYGRLSIAQLLYSPPASFDAPVITADNLKLIATATRDACDQLDGLVDGIVNDPLHCPFDPADLPRCDGAPGADCLTDQQVDVIKKILAGPQIKGRQIFPGFPLSSDMDHPVWAAWMVNAGGFLPPDVPSINYGFSTQFAQYFAYKNSEWDLFEDGIADWDEQVRTVGPLMAVNDPDVVSFRESGGKLLLWHGWSDSGLTPLGSVAFYEAVEKEDPELRDYMLLYMLPGVLHCAGGAGPDQVDWLSELEEWVEYGAAPTDVLARKQDENGATIMERPLCPYPQVVHFEGGDTSARASFTCKSPGG